jgi:hypothetical protein
VPDVVINEFMPSNAATIQDEVGAYPDWIELYNAGDEDVDLGGFTISDTLSEPDKHELADGVIVPAGGFLLLWADDDEEDEGDTHLGFKLSAGGEEIGLYTPEGVAVDEVTFGEMATDISAARTPDGSDTWELTDAPSPGESNGG